MDVVCSLLMAENMSDEEMLLLLTEDNGINSNCRFDFEKLTDEECKLAFRFGKEDIHLLKKCLKIPEIIIITSTQINICGLEALCIFLRRMSYPNRLVDLHAMFGRSKGTLSDIVKHVLEHIHNGFMHLLNSLDHEWTSEDQLRIYAELVHAKGAPLKNCYGFIDGTPRPICRPSKNQRLCYSGHKRRHCLKFQSVMLPNGLITHMFGPLEGCRHDASMLRLSGLLDVLHRKNLKMVDGTALALYGDPAYPLSAHILAPYSGAVITENQQAFNKSMSSVRQCVEWGFGKIIQNFAFLDYHKNLKLYLQPIGKLYLVGAILTNCHTCLYGSLTGSYFEAIPPSLETYLGYVE